MRIVIALALCWVAQGRDGLPARSAPDNYPSKGESPGIVVAAEAMDPEQIRNEFATSLVPRYQVVEVAIYPSKGSTVDVNTLDFGLRVDGRLIRPASPRSIAGLNQKRARSGNKDIRLYPSVGVSTGTWGTGTNVGVGVGMGGHHPGPASTDRDRRVMETELDDRSLQEGSADKPVAGYLYFPVGESKSRSAELIYQHDGGDVKFPIDLPKRK